MLSEFQLLLSSGKNTASEAAITMVTNKGINVTHSWREVCHRDFMPANLQISDACVQFRVDITYLQGLKCKKLVLLQMIQRVW
jgi:hypothetical protein